MYCFSLSLPLMPRAAPLARNRTSLRPRMMAPEFNAGEEYMRQLAKQSADRRIRTPGDGTPPPPPPPPMLIAGVDNELAQLDAQMADLEEKLNKQRAAANSQLNAEQRARLAALEEHLASKTTIDDAPLPPDPHILDNIAAIERQILEEQRAASKSEQAAPSQADALDPGKLGNVRDRLGMHVMPSNTAAAPVAPTYAAPARAPEERVPRREVQADDDRENERLRMGMIEMKLEAERYASAVRKLQETHEQIVHTILQKYMPGL
eukprot:IDg18712t1